MDSNRTVIYSAIIGGLFSIVATFVTWNRDITLNRDKAEHELILAVITGQTTESAARNLTFLAKAGLVRDPNGKIATLEKEPSQAPTVPAVLQPPGDTVQQMSWQALVDALGSSDAKIRTSAAGRLVTDFGSAPEVIDQLLMMIDPYNRSATANGRYNALVVLLETDRSAWSQQRKESALATLQSLQTAAPASGGPIGKKTKQRIEELREFLVNG
jgi:hypothetical protein